MGLSLTRMRVKVRLGLGGLDTSDLADVDLDEILNLSLWELEDKYPFRAKDQRFASTLTDGTAEYPIPTPTGTKIFDAIVSIAVIDGNGQRHKLDRMTRAFYDDIFDDDDKGLPERYLREGNTLTFYPTPGVSEDTFAFEISAKEGIADISVSNAITGLPRNWDEIVVMGGIWRGHFDNQDYELAKEVQSIQTGMLRSTVATETKEEDDSGHAGLEVLHERPAERLNRFPFDVVT